MSHIAPHIGSVIVYTPGAADRVGGSAPYPAMVNAVSTTGGVQTVGCIVFLSDGTHFGRTGVLHANNWALLPASKEDGVGYWAWPGAGNDDALAPGV